MVFCASYVMAMLFVCPFESVSFSIDMSVSKPRNFPASIGFFQSDNVVSCVGFWKHDNRWFVLVVWSSDSQSGQVWLGLVNNGINFFRSTICFYLINYLGTFLLTE